VLFADALKSLKNLKSATLIPVSTGIISISSKFVTKWQSANQRATPKCSVILAQIMRQAESIGAMRHSLYLATRESSSPRKEHP
jgi:hypothetical protein